MEINIMEININVIVKVHLFLFYNQQLQYTTIQDLRDFI